ncbi:MAG TPA: hypothetical protein VMI53_14800, partial [Opitutaceae bacterium]|nr:hypothetical protein [Opitutaceae bacterium]
MKIKFEELPRALDKEISSELANYSVAICRYRGADGHSFRLLGSGTLVTRDGRYGILTAYHCLHECNPEVKLGDASDQKLVFILRGSVQVVIGTDELIERELACPKAAPWGPDLTFIEIPVGPRLSRFKAVGSFWSLDKNWAAVLGNFATPGTCMVCIGYPSVYQETEVKDGHIVKNKGEIHAFLGFLKRGAWQRRGAWDFAQISANYNSSPTLPANFEGVSGGGFWTIRFLKENGVIKIGRICFMGVAFYQTPLKNGKRRIRAHFVRSVYSTAWQSVVCTAGRFFRDRSKKEAC